MAPSTREASRRLTGSIGHISRWLFVSYLADWLVIIVLAILCWYLFHIHGNHHAFALEDLSISYPLVADTVPFTAVVFIAGVFPAVAIVLVSIICPPAVHRAETPNGKSRRRSFPPLRTFLWECNAGWLGLSLSLVGALFVTGGLKDIVGRPRPDLIARCDPDLSNISSHIVGPNLSRYLPNAPTLVDIGICTQTDPKTLRDGFSSFPSGHSSFSCAGLFYLSLWLAAKLHVTIPALPYHILLPNSSSSNKTPFNPSHSHLRTSAAAPPLYLTVIILIPPLVAISVCASRWLDYKHHAFDIIVGALLGAVFSLLGFRMYHLPLSRGGGWTWAPRSRNRAFFAKGSVEGFAAAKDEGEIGETTNGGPGAAGNGDVEMGHMGVDDDGQQQQQQQQRDMNMGQGSRGTASL